MHRLIIPIVLSFITAYATAQLSYTLTYQDTVSGKIKVYIDLGKEQKTPISFIMPRSVPGGHAIFIYDKFIDKISCLDKKGMHFSMTKDVNDAPRWYFRDSGKAITGLTYEVDLKKMETQLAPGDASIVRKGFAGLLNYSIFGWIEGTEKEPVSCTVETMASWPIFTSTHPSVSLEKGRLKFNTADYYSLADGQIFMGDRFRVKKFEGLLPLFVASYSETGDEYLDDYGLQGTMSMGILKDYFGELPFKEYTILLRNAIPPVPGSAPTLAMEHLQSATFFGDTAGIRKKQMSKEELIASMPTYLHHMAHSLIPLRSYGDAYRPYVMEIPPIINNIWFNEGFMWFLPCDTLKLERLKKVFYYNVYNTTAIIKKMSLQELSQIGSTMYGVDFRIGRAIYSRGAMMAMEMNAYLKEKTRGQKSMKDVLRFIYRWSKENKRAFTLDEFPLLINQAAGIDLSGIYRKWQLPIE